MIEKLRGFADGKLDIPESANEIVLQFHERRGDVGERVDALALTKRIVSTGKSSFLFWTYPFLPSNFPTS